MKLVAIFGPTGTGKTTLAAALADRIPCHLVSCDAVQVYRDLRAASAKPEGADARHPWALVDVADPAHDLNLAEYVRRAEREIAWAHRAGLVPVLAGGTGMYLRGVVKGVAPAPPRDEALRGRLLERVERRGAPALHRLLARLDPASAARLQPADRQRIVRALEVRLLTGRPITDVAGDGWRGPDRFETLRIALERPRAELYPALDRRVRQFFDRGLVAEVRWLLDARHVPPGANALRGIGYRDVTEALAAGGPLDVDALVRTVAANTRHYAKRQWTWFRSERPAEWHDPREPRLADHLAQRVGAFFDGV